MSDRVKRCVDPTHLSEDRSKENTQLQMKRITSGVTMTQRSQLMTLYIRNEGPSESCICLGTGSLQVSGNHLVCHHFHCSLAVIFSQCIFTHRSTPVETLHTILLGPYKYLLKATMSTLSAQQKKKKKSWSGWLHSIPLGLTGRFWGI